LSETLANGHPGKWYARRLTSLQEGTGSGRRQACRRDEKFSDASKRQQMAIGKKRTAGVESNGKIIRGTALSIGPGGLRGGEIQERGITDSTRTTFERRGPTESKEVQHQQARVSYEKPNTQEGATDLGPCGNTSLSWLWTATGCFSTKGGGRKVPDTEGGQKEKVRKGPVLPAGPRRGGGRFGKGRGKVSEARINREWRKKGKRTTGNGTAPKRP